MTKIVFLDAATLGDEITLRKPNFPHTWENFAKTKPSEILERAQDADIVVTNKVILNEATLMQLPKLRHIAVTATGTNCVDLDAAKKRGIHVSNVPGYGTYSVSEHVFSMILGLRRSLLAYQRDINQGKWQHSEQFCFYNQTLLDIKGSTIGIVGTGNIAIEVAKIAQAFGANVIFHSVSGREHFEYTNATGLQSAKLVGFDELLSLSDIISIHCPLSAATENLFDSVQFAQMKQSAVLINTARGSIVNLEALYTALTTLEISAAGIDVAPQEPPNADAPILRLNTLSNCIVTPHTAWASLQARQALAEQVTCNIEAAHKGGRLNIVNF